jgi:hypothetical protein
VLIDARNFWKLHGRWFVVTAIATAVAIGATSAAGLRSGRWPGGGSATGLVLGLLAGLIFLFELALVFKKTSAFRTVRWLLPAQAWMKAHIWLGLLTVPLVVLHSGGRFGGTLTSIFVAVFAAVIVSGLWGLALQNWLPRLLVDAAPAETVYSQIDLVGRQYATEARRLVMLACGEGNEAPLAAAEVQHAIAADSIDAERHEHVRGAARHVGVQIKRSPHPASELSTIIPSPTVQQALTRDIAPFLEEGESRSLGSRQRNQWYFDDLRLRVAPELRGLVDRLDALCERRRQLNVQQRVHFWLHNWLWLHLPLSVALLVLLVGHVIIIGGPMRWSRRNGSFRRWR